MLRVMYARRVEDGQRRTCHYKLFVMCQVRFGRRKPSESSLQTLESTSPLTISIIFNALCFETHRYDRIQEVIQRNSVDVSSLQVATTSNVGELD